DYKRAQFDKIIEELFNTDWELLLNGDTESGWQRFKGIMQELEAKYVPTKKVGNNHHHHRFTSFFRTTVRVRRFPRYATQPYHAFSRNKRCGISMFLKINCTGTSL